LVGDHSSKETEMTIPGGAGRARTRTTERVWIVRKNMSTKIQNNRGPDSPYVKGVPKPSRSSSQGRVIPNRAREKGGGKTASSRRSKDCLE